MPQFPVPQHEHRAKCGVSRTIRQPHGWSGVVLLLSYNSTCFDWRNCTTYGTPASSVDPEIGPAPVPLRFRLLVECESGCRDRVLGNGVGRAPVIRMSIIVHAHHQQ